MSEHENQNTEHQQGNEPAGEHRIEGQEHQEHQEHGEGHAEQVTQEQQPATSTHGTAFREGQADSATLGSTGQSQRDPANEDPRRGDIRRAIGPNDPGYGLRPGDVGYAPPARIAQTAGEVLTEQHYDYDRGHNHGSIRGQVPLAMPAPAYETVISDTQMLRPSLMSKAQATAQFQKMFGDIRLWVADFPHELSGEMAVVAQFIRDLDARRAALGTAAALGRTVDPDQVDQAQNTPPPEFFKLRHMAAQLVKLQLIYGQALEGARGELPEQDKETVRGIVNEFRGLADGPQSPEEANLDDQGQPRDLGAMAPENRQHMPRHADIRQHPEAMRDDGNRGSREAGSGPAVLAAHEEGSTLPAHRIAESQPQTRITTGEPVA